MRMERLKYRVRFVTPAFLGNAEQKAQWRTPPFKTLLRQWWRVMHAPKVDFSVDALRTDEAQRFGTSADGKTSRRSLLSLRLSEWTSVEVGKWERDDPITHPELRNRQKLTGAQLYLGYGPLTFGETGARDQQGQPVKGTVLRSEPQRTAIAAGESRTFSLILPREYLLELARTIELANWFGALGSRSRNAWGAVEFEPQDAPALPNLTVGGLAGLVRSLEQCLELDWPHAIGCDAKGPLVWKTNTRSRDWRAVIKELARIKIRYRTQFRFPADGPGSRHILAYPITHHNVWGEQKRVANQLRFKVFRNLDGTFDGLVYHLPCTIPDNALPPEDQRFVRTNQLNVWRAVHKVLDQEEKAARLT